jgi:hypothetical protein
MEEDSRQPRLEFVLFYHVNELYPTMAESEEFRRWSRKKQ